ncbi:MAG: thioredoxin family protein [Bacillota bacterium]|nr:thioredoxin family protein [Bacillota bacterium]
MLFGKKTACCESKSNETASVRDRGIYVLGSGCKKCNDLEQHVQEALKKMGLEEPVYHVKDFAVIASLGVMTTPALVIDRKVVSYGKILSVEECKEFIRNARG